MKQLKTTNFGNYGEISGDSRLSERSEWGKNNSNKSEFCFRILYFRWLRFEICENLWKKKSRRLAEWKIFLPQRAFADVKVFFSRKSIQNPFRLVVREIKPLSTPTNLQKHIHIQCDARWGEFLQIPEDHNKYYFRQATIQRRNFHIRFLGVSNIYSPYYEL